MTKAVIAVGAFATVLVVLLLLALAAGRWALERNADPAAATSSAVAPSATPAPGETHPAAESHQGFLYGRVTTTDGATHEGRLRWGGGEEAFWGDYFNGSKKENPWGAQVPLERLPQQSPPKKIFGVKVTGGRKIDLGRPFMARFGDIAQIEASGGELRVTLKSGTVFDLDRFAADDFADGLRVWDDSRGVVDFDERQIRTIELLPSARPGSAPYRLHGKVRTPQGDFTGFVQWGREEGVGLDTLDGHTADGKLGLRFDTIRSIERRSRESCLVTLLDGSEIVLADTRDVGHGNRGMYVDDRRYGRVLVSWEAFERVDFSPAGSGPAYGDFPAGGPLTGSVTTRAGDRFTGRLVYDLDESETVETLDAPFEGVDYTIPFGLIASIVSGGSVEYDARYVVVTLHGGEVLQLERSGDLGEKNAGMLIFVEDREQPEYVPWADVEQVDFDGPQAIYPPLDAHP